MQDKLHTVIFRYFQSAVDKVVSSEKGKAKQVYKDTKIKYSIKENDWIFSFVVPNHIQTQQKKLILETMLLDLREQFNVVLELEYEDIKSPIFANLYFIRANQVQETFDFIS